MTLRLGLPLEETDLHYTLLGVLVEPHGADTLSQSQEGAVDVSCFFQSVSGVLSPRAALGASQVAQRQSGGEPRGRQVSLRGQGSLEM